MGRRHLAHVPHHVARAPEEPPPGRLGSWGAGDTLVLDPVPERGLAGPRWTERSDSGQVSAFRKRTRPGHRPARLSSRSRPDCTGAAATCAWCAQRLPGEGPARTNHRTPQPGAEHGRVPVSPAGVVCACVEYPPVVCVGARGAGVRAVYYVCVRGMLCVIWVWR